jgi:CCR4-NOT transcriptional regulation complex NOT5 subunit
MYTDYYIRAEDKNSWISQGLAANILTASKDDEGNTIYVPVEGVSIDEIGTIFIPGVYQHNPDGSITVITEQVAKPGYHINIRASINIDTSKLSIIDTPNNPHRVWF